MTKTTTNSKTLSTVLQLALVALLLTAEPSFAQLQKAKSAIDYLAIGLASLGVSILTVIFMWSGYKMAAQQAKWAEISNVVYGGLVAGSAATLAGWVMM